MRTLTPHYKPLALCFALLVSCMQLEYIEIPIVEEIIEHEPEEEPEFELQMSKYELAYEGISYYDAILICNRMSLEEGLDSLYQYDDPIVLDDELFWLPNIKVLENLSGYRLPTKEEWLLAEENGEIKKLKSDVGEWLYNSEGNSQYALFELAPHFVKTAGLYRERDNYPIYGMRVVKFSTFNTWQKF
jgi:hypothetical protein